MFIVGKYVGANMARAVGELESITILNVNAYSEFHRHEDSPSYQARYSKHMNAVSKELGNPFIVDDSVELIQLNTKNAMDGEIIISSKTIEKIGKKKFLESKKSV